MLADDFAKNKYRDKYLKVAEHGIAERTFLGPTLKQEVEEVMVKFQDQAVFNDKISFFKMEYFLYCLRELYSMKQDIKDIKDDIDYFKKKMQQKDSEIQRLKYNVSRATPEQKEQLEKDQKDNNKFVNKIKELDIDYDKKMLIIRKLIDHLLHWKTTAKKVYDQDHFGIPLDTYWLPLDYMEHVDREYDKDEYRLDKYEHVKRSIVQQKHPGRKQPIKAANDETVEAKYTRTTLGYYHNPNDKEELIFKKLIPLAEKTSNEILNIIPDKIRETFKNI
jgi:hypothetical protein